MQYLQRFDPERPQFPPAESAEPSGLVLVGGCLSPAWMLAAYRRGIFPMPLHERRREVLAWFSPHPRGILELDRLHVSRRLQQKIRSGRFRVTHNERFAEVVRACATPRTAHDGVWITPSLAKAYGELRRLGHAHSVEIWDGDQLAGGIFGIAIGGFFAGESMFHHVTDGSKLALAALVDHLRQRQFELFDVQWTNPHTRSLGAADVPRRAYLARLAQAVNKPVAF